MIATARALVPSALRLVLATLAFAHTFPARRHLGLFFEEPSFGEAWKGFGALAAIGLYCLPVRWYARGLAALVRRRGLLFVLSAMMVVVHLVPAADHVPRLLAAPSWADLWRGGGATLAACWFASPLPLQASVVARLARLRFPHDVRGLYVAWVNARVRSASRVTGRSETRLS